MGPLAGGVCGFWIDEVTVGSDGTDQNASLVKNWPGSSTWYLASSSRCTLNRSSGYRKCSRSSSEISDSGWTMPGKAFIHVCSTGSDSSNAYRSTVPS